ncbi:hypothetical protein DTQ70_24115 [Runella sp. SP2]|nr:hypothetical protein DTQ70_24115 [Runella sp. SP2]
MHKRHLHRQITNKVRVVVLKIMEINFLLCSKLVTLLVGAAATMEEVNPRQIQAVQPAAIAAVGAITIRVGAITTTEEVNPRQIQAVQPAAIAAVGAITIRVGAITTTEEVNPRQIQAVQPATVAAVGAITIRVGAITIRNRRTLQWEMKKVIQREGIIIELIPTVLTLYFIGTYHKVS